MMLNQMKKGISGGIIIVLFGFLFGACVGGMTQTQPLTKKLGGYASLQIQVNPASSTLSNEASLYNNMFVEAFSRSAIFKSIHLGSMPDHENDLLLQVKLTDPYANISSGLMWLGGNNVKIDYEGMLVDLKTAEILSKFKGESEASGGGFSISGFSLGTPTGKRHSAVQGIANTLAGFFKNNQ